MNASCLRRQGGLHALLPWLGLGSLVAAIAGAQGAAAAPAPAPSPAAVSAPAPASAPCPATSGAALAAFRGSPIGSIVSKATILPSNAQTQFVYLQPAGQKIDQPEFTVFLSKDLSKAADEKPLLITRIVHPVSDLSALAKDAGADTSNAYSLNVSTPSVDLPWALERETLTVIACQKVAGTGSATSDVLVGSAQLPVWVSNKYMDIFISVAFMACVYLFAGWMRMLADGKAKSVNLDLADRFAPGADTRSMARVSGNSVSLKPLDYFDPVVLSADIFNRASLSQFQILIFLMLVGYSATYSMLRTGTLSELSPSIVYLLGIPAVGALGSQAVTATRGAFSVDNWSWLVSHGVLAVDDPGTARPLFRDLLMTGKQIDLYRLQALTFTIIVGAAMVYSGGTDLETFNVPSTLLSILGLSQVVFVGGRLTQPATIGDTDSLITELRKRIGELRVAAATGIDVDANGQPLSNPNPGAVAIAVKSLDQARTLVPNAVARYEETANEVSILLKGLTYRDVVTTALDDPFSWGGPQSAAPAPGQPPQPPNPPAIPRPGAPPMPPDAPAPPQQDAPG
jgi:hypothetical protein